jgi:hypothetical protein
VQGLPFSFPNASGVGLSRSLELPTDVPCAFAIFAHCFTCGKNLKATHTISRTLAEHRLATTISMAVASVYTPAWLCARLGLARAQVGRRDALKREAVAYIVEDLTLEPLGHRHAGVAAGQ